MIVVGGFIGNDNECDLFGIYVFDVIILEWKNKFEVGDYDEDYEIDNIIRSGLWGYKVLQVV